MKISELHTLFIKSNGICTDTRSIQSNQLFFAIKGENFDGNRFAEQALSRGASYAVVQDKSLAELPRAIWVEDVLKTLQALACYHRKQFDIPVIGITGSNGKTTSKELINAVLSESYNVLVTEGNLNNHLGVPFTLLRINNGHDMAIIEMGANKPGDIKELVEIALPTHGVITNIGKAHLEGFGSLEGVIRTKTELYDQIEAAEGVVFINRDDAILTNTISKQIKTVGYGRASEHIEGTVEVANPFIAFTWRKEAYQSPIVKTHLVGGYNMNNFLLAICIGDFFDVPADAMNRSLEAYQPTNNRSQIIKTEKNTLIVDCYNANPSSMQSAIQSFKAIDAGDKLMILGDMLELGAIKNEEHQVIIDLVKEEGLSTIFVGHIFQSLQPDAVHYESVSDLMAGESLNQLDSKTILLKGSRGIKLESLIEHL